MVISILQGLFYLSDVWITNRIASNRIAREKAMPFKIFDYLKMQYLEHWDTESSLTQQSEHSVSMNLDQWMCSAVNSFEIVVIQINWKYNVILFCFCWNNDYTKNYISLKKVYFGVQGLYKWMDKSIKLQKFFLYEWFPF